MSRRGRLGPIALAAGAAAVTLGLGGSATGVADTTPPVITSTINGAKGEERWYRSNVTVSWSFSDPESGITNTWGCNVRTFTEETSGVVHTCEAENGVGLRNLVEVTVRIDKTPPAVSGSLDRPPDLDGWHRTPVSASFSGSDARSSIFSCTAPVTYTGPDSASGQVTGSCRDRAGNESSTSVPVKYDATAPVVTKLVPGRRPDKYGWFGRLVRFTVHGDDATSGIASCDAPLYAGPNSATASVSGTCRDRAGNVSAAGAVTFKYSSPLLSPASGRNVKAPVLLTWIKVERARFYNLQVWKGRQKILSAWPRGTSFKVRRTWRYAGRRYALRPGERYRWYVWPRIGSGYGPMVGRSFFDVVRASR
jgi:hypothetical protein